MTARRRWHRATARLASIGLLASLGGCLGVGGAAPCADPCADCAARVYLIRGFVDIFSLGLDDLAAELRARGLDARTASAPQSARDAAERIAAQGDGATPGPLVLGGHSLGADDAIRVAKELQELGLNVDLLILIDATTPDAVPDNVARCIHYRPPNGWNARFPPSAYGKPVVLEEGNTRTELVLVLVDVATFGPEVADVNHFDVDSSGPVHAAIIDEIERLCTIGRY